MKIETFGQCIGTNLRKAIYARAKALDADYVEVLSWKFDKVADVSMFDHGNCIGWHITCTVKED